MKQITKFLALFIFITSMSCSSNDEETKVLMSGQDIVPEKSTDKQFELSERKLIKEGFVEFEVERISNSRINFFKAVSKYGGYVSSDEEFKTPDRTTNTIVIRVPSQNFDNLLNEATKGIDKFDRKNIQVKDVTEEFLDIDARLKTKMELESRLLELLKLAKNVTEILEIEKQLGELRSDIESVEGRMKYLQSRISLSTLTLTFYESNSIDSEFGQKFKNSFKNGWNNFVEFFVFLSNIWPFIIFGVIMLLGFRLYKKRKKE